MEAVTITLTKPIPAHGKTLEELTMRPVTAKDIRQCGVPFLVSNGGNDQRVDAEAISKFIVNCAEIPMSSVDLLAPADWFAARGVILNFLMGSTPEAPST